MTTCLTELYLWSLKGNVSIPNHVIGCHSYHDKGETGSNSQYYEEKQQFTEGRDMVWAPKNKRPEKLKDNIKEMEELLSAFKMIELRWRSRKCIQMILSNACIINIVLTGHSGDIEKLLIDKSLVGKLSAEMISHACLTDQYIITSYLDKARIDYIYFCKRPPLGEAIRKLEKVSTWEPKITPIDIPGPVNRRLDRKLSVNMHQDMALVWWSNSSKEAMPWSPMASDKDRANLIIISIHGPNVDVLTFNRTECDPVFAGFSKLQPHKMYTVEQGMSSGGETTAKACTYEVVQGKIQRVSIVNIPLKSMVHCESRSPGEDKLLLGCADGTLVVYDENRKITQMNRAGLVPSLAAWHPTGTIFFVGSNRGDIQVFDMALSPLKIQLLAEEPNPHRFLPTSKFFKAPPPLREIQWCPFDPQAADWTGDYTDALAVVYDRGPVGVLLMSLGVVSRERLSCVELVKEYIRSKQIEDAVALLCSMNWDIDGTSCYTCLTAIVTHLLKMPLNAEREVHLETALGTFYLPKRPLSEMTILDYRDPISRLARRFFHHLLRYARFDKAYLLAVDIGARDLFMDIHYMALDKGENALAEVARKKAEQVDSESLDSFEDELPGMEGHFFQQHNGSTVNLQRTGSGSRNRENIPASRQHPWQQDQRSPQVTRAPLTFQQSSSGGQSDQSHNASPRVSNNSSQSGQRSGRRRVQYSDQQMNQDFDGIDLNSDFIRDYTAALNEGGTSNQSNGQQEDGSNVIHFGVV
ncbi:WD repeat-containing and planar cell polarity effector protein fritz homolog [Ruditapes philippinarum]|uniref:WD repeat-containing and planar cell polarity effector protein fritz homolog n=1 Tax=Ruditapes philippinarum TaxID=129788 RepID=UPI00295AC0DF|nr:WD repeat-containing and planar cell polarity effector protein fritz homolog [Ruditapes philippinarum]